ncbi:hypothetical protein [Clostridium botulinum]|uniref:hypothetical protein n=1 Tax=Clostridium botulinum TaxID=1491 RepID=UPI0004D3C1AD|nr:hypothetical protein [Clostridium botulinum]KEH96452.1 conserved hypothetical phage-related protein [Clostridium botulinum D str. 16868]KOA77335.1 hypothetical protein ADU78_03865 [Clostridium botulinum]KOA90637.1 hypothetical protein ADU76_13225 [Clostridium botulinum]KOC34952.1 hypothetical protein ADU81_04895 [Clostridium botulinum]MCD3202488.1 hypothetical protein [Clostridium botulinum C/D]
MKIKSRDELGKNKNEIDKLLEQELPKMYALYPKMVYDVAEQLEDKNITIGTISGLFGGITPTYKLEEVDELGSFLKAIYEVGTKYSKNKILIIPNLEKLNPENFYTETEINSINLYKKEVSKENNIIKLYVRKNAENHYVCPYISMVEYVDYYKRGLIIYNPNTQRETTKKMVKGQINEFITIHQENVNKIYNDLKNDRFNPNMLTLNIRDNEGDDPQFDDGGMNVGDFGWLKIKVDGRQHSYVDLLDGQHRTSAQEIYVEEYPNTDKYNMLNVFVFNEEQAIHHIIQENSGTKIDENSLQRRDPDNKGVAMAKELKTLSKELKGKVANDLIELTKHCQYTDVLTLGSAINNYFDIDGRKEYREIRSYLSKFFDVAIDCYKDYFNKSNLQPKELFYRKNTFIAFCDIAKKLYKFKDWEDKAFDIFEKLSIEEVESVSGNKKILKPNDYKIISNKLQKSLAEREVAIDG